MTDALASVTVLKERRPLHLAPAATSLSPIFLSVSQAVHGKFGNCGGHESLVTNERQRFVGWLPRLPSPKK